MATSELVVVVLHTGRPGETTILAFFDACLSDDDVGGVKNIICLLKDLSTRRQDRWMTYSRLSRCLSKRKELFVNQEPNLMRKIHEAKVHLAPLVALVQYPNVQVLQRDAGRVWIRKASLTYELFELLRRAVILVHFPAVQLWPGLITSEIGRLEPT